MSCKDCEEAQIQEGSYHFRWKNANIELRGCPKHIKEIMEELRK